MSARVLGNYRIEERLGEGGMGTVYRATDLMLEREVAVKVLRTDLVGHPDVETRFRDEALTLARLNHPNIATLYSLVREGGELFMVMELIKGQSLESILARERVIDPCTAAGWCAQALDAMAYAHSKGVIHRDIKPANLMLADSGLIKVMDFGIARVLGGQRKTRDGRIVGTIAYMSPEQVRGLEVDGRTDIYALGTVLYELVTGRLPFECSDEFQLMCAQINEAPVPPRDRRAAVPKTLDEAILKALAKAPQDRYQTAAEFEVALSNVQPPGVDVQGARTRPAADRSNGPTQVNSSDHVKPTRVADASVEGEGQDARPDSPAHESVLDIVRKMFHRED